MTMCRRWVSQLFIALVFLQSTACKKPTQSSPPPTPASTNIEVDPKPAQAESCTWRGEKIDNDMWVDDGENNSQNRFCKCEAGKFVQCGQEIPASVTVDQVVKIKSTSRGEACIWKGSDIANGRWVEDSTAKYRYCKCEDGKFPAATCLSTLPPTVKPQDVVTIATEAYDSCSTKGVTIPHDKWAEDAADTATFKYCQCKNGSFPVETCGATLPSGVNASDVIKVSQTSTAGAECKFKGVTIPHDKWAEDVAGTAASKFCQCKNGKFVTTNCSATAPTGVNSADIIKIP